MQRKRIMASVLVLVVLLQLLIYVPVDATNSDFSSSEEIEESEEKVNQEESKYKTVESVISSMQSEELSLGVEDINIHPAFGETSIRINTWVYNTIEDMFKNECFLSDEDLDITVYGTKWEAAFNPYMILAVLPVETTKGWDVNYCWSSAILAGDLKSKLDSMTEIEYDALGSGSYISDTTDGIFQITNPEWSLHCESCGLYCNDKNNFRQVSHEMLRNSFEDINSANDDAIGYLNDESTLRLASMMLNRYGTFASADGSSWVGGLSTGTWGTESRQAYMKYIQRLADNDELNDELKERARQTVIGCIKKKQNGEDISKYELFGDNGVNTLTDVEARIVEEAVNLTPEFDPDLYVSKSKGSYNASKYYPVKNLYNYYVYYYLYHSGDLV